MIGRTRYAAHTLPYYGNKELVREDHTTPLIVAEMKKAHRDYAGDYDQIADEYWEGNVQDTAHLLFKVLKKNVVYDVEHPDNQQVKSPGAIFHQRHGDCKHYASVIIGVADALRRKGKKIKGRYRFVADGPDQEIHHVFAVLEDEQGNEVWVDPVLSTFNTQPVFYNIKDVDMALYRVSGTAVGALDPYGRPYGLPEVGKSKNNIFKRIAHGIQVSTHDAGQAVAKGAHNTVKKVEHIALNVGAAPARNAFLALLDLNAFNLATRMSDAWTSHRKEVAAEWQKLGGNEQKLLAAINNGRKHKAFYHNQAPAKRLSGSMDDVLNGRSHHMPVYVHLEAVPCYKHAYARGHDDRGRLPTVSGIGEPVSVATLSALASAIIAVFSKWMKPDKGDQNATEAAKQGVANIVQNASDAIDAGQTETGLKMMEAAAKGSQAVANMQVAAGTTPDGVPAVAVTEFTHPQLTNAGTPQGAAAVGPADYAQPADDDTAANRAVSLPDKITRDVAGDITRWVTKVWDDYKAPIIFTVAGVGFYKVLTIKKKGRR